MFGYDWPRLHAALNDLPAALLLCSVLFDLLGTVNKRDSLKAAGFWTLIAGVLGTAAAWGSGEMAEGVIEHSDRAHAVLETHETLGIIVLILFGLLMVWRIVRRGVLGEKERPVALTAGVIGVALLVYAAKLGGNLVFDHGAGIRSATMESIQADRATRRVGAEEEEHQHGTPAGDSSTAPAAVPVDTTKRP